MRDLASHIIEAKSAEFDPSRFEDRYETAVAELIRSKQSGQPVKTESAPRPSNVVNLIEALRRSIDAEKPGAGAKKAPSKSSVDRAAEKAASKEASSVRQKGELMSVACRSAHGA